MQENLIKILHNFLNFSVDTEGSVFIENLKSGHINDTFKVIVNQQNFILQRVNTAIFPEPLKIMENIETVANHLKSKDYTKSILEFVKTKNNASIHFDGEDAWRLMPFIGNTYSILKVENENQAFIAAEAFGEYLNFLSDLDVNTIHTILPNFHNADFRIQQHQDALKNTPSVSRLKMRLVATDNATCWTNLPRPRLRRSNMAIMRRLLTLRCLLSMWIYQWILCSLLATRCPNVPLLCGLLAVVLYRGHGKICWVCAKCMLKKATSA